MREDKNRLPFTDFSPLYDIREGIVSVSEEVKEKEKEGQGGVKSPPFGAVYHRSI